LNYFYVPAKNPEMRQSISLGIILLFLSTFVAGQHYSPGQNEADPDWLEQFLYSGVEWRPEFHMVSGHEFFLTSEYLDADITVEGISFRNVRIRYDICNDNVIILWKSNFPIALSRQRIDGFTVRHDGTERRFVNYHDAFPEFSGFAEVLYSGGTTFVARHTKALNYNPSSTTFSQFMDYTKYFYMINGTCNQVKSRRTFLKLMGDHEQEVKRYIRQNNILMSNFSPAGFSAVAAYHDSLVAKRAIE